MRPDWVRPDWVHPNVDHRLIGWRARGSVYPIPEAGVSIMVRALARGLARIAAYYWYVGELRKGAPAARQSLARSHFAAVLSFEPRPFMDVDPEGLTFRVVTF